MSESDLFSREVAAAQREVATKSLREIQAETAVKWCARAVAAQGLGADSDAKEYAHEALEHSVLCSDDRVLTFVRRVLAGLGLHP